MNRDPCGPTRRLRQEWIYTRWHAVAAAGVPRGRIGWVGPRRRLVLGECLLRPPASRCLPSLLRSTPRGRPFRGLLRLAHVAIHRGKCDILAPNRDDLRRGLPRPDTRPASLRWAFPLGCRGCRRSNLRALLLLRRDIRCVPVLQGQAELAFLNSAHFSTPQGQRAIAAIHAFVMSHGWIRTNGTSQTGPRGAVRPPVGAVQVKHSRGGTGSRNRTADPELTNLPPTRQFSH